MRPAVLLITMMTRTILFAALSSLVFACSAATQPDDVATSEGAATIGSTMDAVFAGVTPDAPKCFMMSYASDHMRSHPKQTVTDLRIELSESADSNAARITFLQASNGGRPRIRDLSCALVNGSVLCTEEPTCTSSVTLTKTAEGLRMTNRDLRASGACDETPKPLDATRGADDVFDLLAVSCSVGALANPPTMSCAQALFDVRTCIDVMPGVQCENMITKGTRYADEFQSSAADDAHLESSEECIQRFTDIAQEDGCCAG